MSNRGKRFESDDLRDKSVGRESTRQSGSEGYGSSSGRSSNLPDENIDKNKDRENRESMESNKVRGDFRDEH